MEAAPAPDAGMEQEAEGTANHVLQLAEATVAGDMQAAQELGVMMAPMILEQVQAGGGPGGAEAAPAEAPTGEPVFARGGTFQRKE